MEIVNIFFLHGFLGCPSDWDSVISGLPKKRELRTFTPDLFREEALSPRQPFDAWAQDYNQWVRETTSATDINILVGYSLGGRLAMHALKHAPELWSRSVIISANPGFQDTYEGLHPDSAERQARWVSDSSWAEQFLLSPWADLMSQWNSQPVFRDSQSEPQRLEAYYDRNLLSLALRQWSLAKQKNMRSTIRRNASQMVWVVGELDQKFLSLSQDLNKDIADLRVEVIPAASHRILFDQPEKLAEVITNLVLQLV